MRNTNAFPREWLEQIFLVGNTPTTALRNDPRFSYSLYVPDAHYPNTPESPKFPLVVNAHGTRREYLAARYHLQPLANEETTACAVLAPLFPAGITGDEDLGSYRQVIAGARDGVPGSEMLRYDNILLSIIDEVALCYTGIDTFKFLLAGFSGGGQFVPRFFYFHPDMLLAVSVRAPGNTLLFGKRLSLLEKARSSDQSVSNLVGTNRKHPQFDVSCHQPSQSEDLIRICGALNRPSRLIRNQVGTLISLVQRYNEPNIQPAVVVPSM